MSTYNEDTEGEIMDYFEFLSDFLDLEDSKINSVIILFNEVNGKVSYEKLSEITGIKSMTTVINIRDALAALVHYETLDKGLIEGAITSAKMEYNKIEKIKKLLSSFIPESKKNLEFLYQIQINTENPDLLGLDHQLLISHFDKDEKKFYFPVLRLRLDYLDTNNEEMSTVFFMPLERFSALVKQLNDIEVDILKEARNLNLGEITLL